MSLDTDPDRPVRIGQAGFTLIEVAAVVVALSVFFGGVAAVVLLLANASGKTSDDWNTFERGEAALERIRAELSAAVQNPEGLSIAPAYAVSATSITFRPPIGYLDPDDPGAAALIAAGRVSANGIVYADYAKTIAYDAQAGTLTLTVTGTVPATMRPSEVLATGVTAFALSDGESHALPPADATIGTWVIGVRLEVQRASAMPAARGSMATSSLRGDRLAAKILVPPETLTNTRSKPAVEP